MYACLYASGCPTATLLDLAFEFSPIVEQTSSDTVVFPIAPLSKLLGSPSQIASELCRGGYERKLQANLAIASDPDTVILLARNCPGVTLVSPGQERLKLGPLPLTALFTHTLATDPALLAVLHRWGVKTCEELAALPEHGIAERLGTSGIYLRNLARGISRRPLRAAAPAASYEERIPLEHPLHLLEPLLFLLGRVVSELCGRLRSQSRAARLLAGYFELETQKDYRFELEFPVPLDESRTILKLLQLHLERHPPEAAVTAFTLRVEPVEPRHVQGGIFLPPTPAPDKLQVTLARVAGMVGKENVGTPVLLNTHRPDAFEMTTLGTQAASTLEHHPETPRLAMRLFRPALRARVRVVKYTPKNIAAPGVKGTVIQYAGPWKTSGEWWAATSWSREEWDVALDDGALYRIYQESQNREWFVHGVYD